MPRLQLLALPHFRICIYRSLRLLFAYLYLAILRSASYLYIVYAPDVSIGSALLFRVVRFSLLHCVCGLLILVLAYNGLFRCLFAFVFLACC